jgi:RNA polymerase sigma-70 factor (ECF subfamily)
MGLILAEPATPCKSASSRDNEATRATHRKSQMDRAEILTRLRERIVRYAASQLQGSSTGDLAQDLAQEVLIVLHEKYSELDRIEDLLPLSLEIARLKIWAARRKSRRRGEDREIPVEDLSLAADEADPFEQAARAESVARLQAALAELGERCRELYRLKLEGYTFPEIQKRLKVSALNTLYTWDFRCRKQLLERLGDWDKPG